MTTEDGRTLFCAEITAFKWRKNAGDVAPQLVLTQIAPNFDGTNYIWTSEPYDVRGLPDITIQVVEADSGDEGAYGLHIEGSLDGGNWTRIPDSMFSPDLSTVAMGTGDLTLLSILLKVNFIRLLIYATQGPPFQATEFDCTIVAGEA